MRLDLPVLHASKFITEEFLLTRAVSDSDVANQNSSFSSDSRAIFRLEGESGKCAPISLTTLGRPTVLACGFTALLSLSGDWAKLATLKHCSILIQINLRYSSAQKGILGVRGISWSGHPLPWWERVGGRVNPPFCAAEHRKSVWIKHDECLSAASFRRVQTDWEAQGTRRASCGLPVRIKNI